MKNYCFNKGIERLKQFEITEFENWYMDKLIHYDDYPLLDCWQTLHCKYYENVDIPLKKVIGTGHINYANRTWLENLGCLKRFSPYFTKDYSTKYFLSEDRRVTNSYAKFGDDYIILGGNHRTHSARFLGFESIKGNVTEYFFDYELYTTIEEYKKENIIFNSDNIYKKIGWNFKIGNFMFYINEFEVLKEFIQLYKNTNTSWLKYKKFQLMKFFDKSNFKDFVHINDTIDLDKPIFKYLSALKYEKLITNSNEYKK